MVSFVLGIFILHSPLDFHLGSHLVKVFQNIHFPQSRNEAAWKVGKIVQRVNMKLFPISTLPSRRSRLSSRFFPSIFSASCSARSHSTWIAMLFVDTLNEETVTIVGTHFQWRKICADDIGEFFFAAAICGVWVRRGFLHHWSSNKSLSCDII